jgi:P-type Ca2+ transporter type 2C
MIVEVAIGLSSAEARDRLARHGPNELARAKGTPPARVFLRQFLSPMVALLVAAAVLSGALGDMVDAIAIGTIVVLNAAVGFFQEYRAERAVLALRKMTAPRARVMRDGHISELSAGAVVPGDLLLLEAGDVVSADADLVQANALTTQEAALTGESTPSEKLASPVAVDTPMADRHDRVYAGTSVARGTGHAVVYATGMATELGKIAHLLATTPDEATPLQNRLARVSRVLIGLSGSVVVAVAGLGLLRGQPWLEVLLGAVSLAVAAVPEGLPAVITVALALGVRRMASRNVLVRRLSSVETLGSTTVICTDKTGTLTTGKMVVREIWGPDPDAVLRAAVSCCDADPPVGDPTEVAIVLKGRERGFNRTRIEQENPRTAVNPFDATRKRMSIQRADGVLYVKGAVDLLLRFCVEGPSGAALANETMAKRGLRVLAVAVGHGIQERDLTLLGLIGIADPPRPDAIEAIDLARRAGITTVMITGDHPTTAHAIAREIGILELDEGPEEKVHARATPEQKVDIVRAWKEKGAVVAMTGDGVNDAPAFREADIGIAMGEGGTEVTREAADMVLADDNFASIVAAVREGRAIHENIRKTLVYLLAGNAAELILMFVAASLGMPFPLLPLQLLWINLVTDGLPALALVMDPPERDLLTRPPRPTHEPILGRNQWLRVAVRGLLQAGVALSVFAWALDNKDLATARTLAFSTLVFGELFRAFSARSATRVLWEVGIFSNARLLAVILVSGVLQIAIHQFPVTRELFGVVSLTLRQGLLAVGLGLIPVTVIELSKLARRRDARHRRPAVA